MLRSPLSAHQWSTGSRLGATAAASIGLVALAGWLTGTRALAAVGSSYVPMLPATAALFVLLGASQLVAAADSRRLRVLARCVVAASFAVAVAHVTGYASGTVFAGDQWLFAARAARMGAGSVGRMSIFTALSFALICPAIFVHSLPRRPRLAGNLASVLALLVTLAGLVFSLGYVYRAPLLYGGAGTPMSLPTAAAFFALGLSIVIPALRRQRAEQRERERERDQIDGAFEHAALGIALVAPDGRWLRVNRAMSQMLGYSERELLATTFQAVTHPDDVDTDVASVRAMLAGDLQSYQMEKRYLHRDGRVIWALLSVSLARHANGAPRYFISQVQDITERKGAQVQLTRQALVFETIGDGVFVMDVGGIIADCNPAACRLFGYSKAELLGQPVATVHDPALEGGLEAEIQASLHANHRWAGELPFQRKDGTKGVADVAVVAQLDAQGQPVAWIGVNRDVTARRRAEAELRAAHATVATLLDASPLAILALDLEHRVTMWNPAAERLFGWAAEEVLGRPLPVVSDAYASDFAQRTAEVLGGRSVSGVETRRRRKDGTLVDVLLSAAPLHDGAGSVTGLVAVLMDATERKELEEQLRQAQRLEAIGQLAGGIAHDFNNLLTVIISYAAMLLEDFDPDHPKRDDVEEIAAAAGRAATLTNQLLAFGRRQLLQPRVVDVNDTVSGLERMLQRLLTADVRLITELDPALGRVRADPGQLEQVLMNLVVNARDAMPHGGTVIIETANVDAADASTTAYARDVRPGAYVRLVVCDNGHGMDEATKARIFEPFFTTKEIGKGTGLGLSTVYGIVEQSGGYVRCTSEPGKGTAFTIHLPRVEALAERADGGPWLGAGRGGTENVLIVEDDEAVRAATRRILATHGYTVLEASDGAAALRLCERSAPAIDLILTDVIMPEMSGPEMATQLRKRNPAVRMLFMSGHTGEAARRHDGLTTGAAFIEKPFTPDNLVAKVREILDQSPADSRLLQCK